MLRSITLRVPAANRTLNDVILPLSLVHRVAEVLERPRPAPEAHPFSSTILPFPVRLEAVALVHES